MQIYDKHVQISDRYKYFNMKICNKDDKSTSNHYIMNHKMIQRSKNSYTDLNNPLKMKTTLYIWHAYEERFLGFTFIRNAQIQIRVLTR